MVLMLTAGIAFRFSGVASANACKVNGDECASTFYNGNPGTECATYAASHNANASPNIWLAGTANICGLTHTARVEIFLYDSGGGVIGSCDTGFVNDYVKCKVNGNPASALHFHDFDSGLYPKSYFSWQSLD
jgi:hypothetical protein